MKVRSSPASIGLSSSFPIGKCSGQFFPFVLFSSGGVHVPHTEVIASFFLATMCFGFPLSLGRSW